MNREEELLKLLEPFIKFGEAIIENPFMDHIPDDTKISELRLAPKKSDYVNAAKAIKRPTAVKKR
jgi:hypothetical protein